MDTLVVFGLSSFGCPKYAGERKPVGFESLTTTATSQPPQTHSPTEKMKKSLAHPPLTYTQSQSKRLFVPLLSLPRCFPSPCFLTKSTHLSLRHHSGHLWMHKKLGSNSRSSIPLLFSCFVFSLLLSDDLYHSSVSAVRPPPPPASPSSLSQSPEISSLSFPDVSRPLTPISSVPVFHHVEATQSALTSQAPLHSSLESGWSQGDFHRFEGSVRNSPPLSSVLTTRWASPGHATISLHPFDPPVGGTSLVNLYPSRSAALSGSIAYARKQKQHSPTLHDSGERFSSSFSLFGSPLRGPFSSSSHAEEDSLHEDITTNEEAPRGAPPPFPTMDSSPPSFSFLGLLRDVHPRALDTGNDERKARWARAPGSFSFLSSSSPDTSATTFNPLQFLHSLWGGGESSQTSHSPSSLHPAAPDASHGTPEKPQQEADSQEENASVSEPSGAENKTVSPSPASEQDSSGVGPQSGDTGEKKLPNQPHAEGGESQPPKPEGEESHEEAEGGSSEEKDSKASEESKNETEREGETAKQEASSEPGAEERKLPENTSQAADAGSTTVEEPGNENESSSSEEKPGESQAGPSGKEDASNNGHEGEEGGTNKEEEKSPSLQANSGTQSPEGGDAEAGAAKTEEPKSENESKEEDEKAKTEKEPSSSSPEEASSTDSVEEEKSSTEAPEQQGGEGPAKNEESSTPGDSNGDTTTTNENEGSNSKSSGEPKDGADTEPKTEEAESQENTGGSESDQNPGEEEEEGKSVQNESAEETKQSETEASPPSPETAEAQEDTAQTPENKTPSQGESGEESHQDSTSATSTASGDDSGDTTNKTGAKASSSPSKEQSTETPPPEGGGTNPEDSSGESNEEASSEAEASASEGDGESSHGDQEQLGENKVQGENPVSTQGSSEEKPNGEQPQVEEHKTESETSSPSPSPPASTTVAPGEETGVQKQSSESGEGGGNQKEEGSPSGEEQEGVGDGGGVAAAVPAVKTEEQLPSASVIFKFCRGGENEQGKSTSEGRETSCDPERDDSLGKIAVRVDNSLNLDLSRHEDWARVGRAMNAWLKHRYFSGREGKKMGWAHALHACVSGWMETQGTVSPKWIMMKEKMPEPTQRERQMFLDFYTEDKKTGHRTPSKVSCFRFLSHIHYFLLTAKKADQDVKGDEHTSFPLIIKSSADMDFPAFVKERPELLANLVPPPPKERQKGEPINDDETARREGLPSLAFAFSMAQQHRSRNALASK